MSPGRILLLGALCGGCVATAPTRPTRGEAMHGPPPPPGHPPTAAGLGVPGPRASAEPRPAPAPGGRWVWVRGYWHWDGVRYVRVPGRWEQAHPGYAWRR